MTGGPAGAPSAHARSKREERERRRAQRRRAVRLRALLVAVVIVALAGLGIAAYRSQLFAVERVEVSGNTRVTEAAVIERAAVSADATLLRFGRAAIVERLVADPWIESAVVTRDFPATLHIHITERVPFAMIDTIDSFWLVDSAGLVLAESLPDTSTLLPVVRDVPELSPEAGVRPDSAVLANALAVLDGISSEVLATVRAVSAPSVAETALVTADGVEIMVGEAVLLAEKSALIAGILAEQGSGVVFIDVRSIDRPISRGLE